jgi:hypothetical protein
MLGTDSRITIHQLKLYKFLHFKLYLKEYSQPSAKIDHRCNFCLHFAKPRSLIDIST